MSPKRSNKLITVTCLLIQRIRGQKIQPELRFFGQAIDGDIDLGEDGLPDMVIGSQGAAVVLRYIPSLLQLLICSKLISYQSFLVSSQLVQFEVNEYLYEFTCT